MIYSKMMDNLGYEKEFIWQYTAKEILCIKILNYTQDRNLHITTQANYHQYLE